MPSLLAAFTHAALPIRRTLGLTLIHSLALIFTLTLAPAQSIYRDGLHQFLSFESIPTWTGVATDWDKPQPQVHLYDSEKYKGHAQFVSVGLGTGITFATFKEQVKDPATRRYMPFFLFDLRKHPARIEGTDYTWALRIEDYGFQDNEAQITATTQRLLDIMRAYINKESGKKSRGIIVLSGNPKSLPYKSIAPALAQAGYPFRSVNQLIELSGGKRVQVMNPGLAIGRLRFVKENDPILPSPQDIVVYDRMPVRLPPVAGIVTLEPQTPLSHVNLLALNRGTLNVYALDTLAIPGLTQHWGKLVRMEARDGKLSLHTATEAEAKKHWAQARLAVELPFPDTTVRGVVDLGGPNAVSLTARQVGSKAANYALLQSKFPKYVRPGMAIPFAPYLQVIRNSGADTLIAALTLSAPQLDQAAIESRLETIRKRIEGATLSQAFIAQILKALRNQYPDRNLRLRSSTNCEDLPNFNGAGLYLSSKLGKDATDADFQANLLSVYASLWTPVAWAERAYYGIDHRKAAMAILVNQSYSKEFANGVAITVPKPEGISIVINAQSGETAITNPSSGTIPEGITFATAQAKTFTVQSSSSIEKIFEREDLKPYATELRDLTVQIHNAMQAQAPKIQGRAYGVDIEWKLMAEDGGYKLYVKQARLLAQVLPE